MADFSRDLYWWYTAPVDPSLPAEVVTLDVFDLSYLQASFSSDLISLSSFDLSADGHGWPLANPSFEYPETESGVEYDRVPESWTIIASGQAMESGTFGPPHRWVESYEALWSGNQSALIVFTSADITVGTFGTTEIGAESYEREWKGDDWPFVPTNEHAIGEFVSAAIDRGLFGSTDASAESYEVEWFARHPVADRVHFLSDSWPLTLITICDQLNTIKLQFNEHVLSSVYHLAPDTGHEITAPFALDLPSAIVLATDIWNNVWDHVDDISDAWHLPRVAAHEVGFGKATYPPTNQSQCGQVAITGSLLLDFHFAWASADKYGFYSAWSDWGGSTDHLLELWYAPNEVEAESYEWFPLVPFSLDAGQFEDYAGTKLYEEHDAYWPIAATAGGPGAATACNSSEWFDSTIEVESWPAGLVIDVEVRRPRSNTFTQAFRVTDSVIVGTTHLDVEQGFEAVRTNTITWVGGGVFAFQRSWRQLSTL